jgi:hypothetical protein
MPEVSKVVRDQHSVSYEAHAAGHSLFDQHSDARLPKLRYRQNPLFRTVRNETTVELCREGQIGLVTGALRCIDYVLSREKTFERISVAIGSVIVNFEHHLFAMDSAEEIRDERIGRALRPVFSGPEAHAEDLGSGLGALHPVRHQGGVRHGAKAIRVTRSSACR